MTKIRNNVPKGQKNQAFLLQYKNDLKTKKEHTIHLNSQAKWMMCTYMGNLSLQTSHQKKEQEKKNKIEKPIVHVRKLKAIWSHAVNSRK